MFPKKAYELPITVDYISHWGLLEGIREIIQNALDSDSPFEWDFTDGILSIQSRFSKLEPKTLLLGSTTKADNKDKIGSFGEGYKLALLVLHRAGYKIRVINNGVVWTPEFKFNTRYETDILYVIETKNDVKSDGVIFEIGGLSHEDMGQIRMSCLDMQEKIGERKLTSKGRILLEQQGRLYVGGLYICDTGLKYGYDIKPEFVTLERDRRTVDNWDLQCLTRDMWFETQDYESMCIDIEKETPDLSYAQYDSPSILKEAVYRYFRKKNPDAVIAKDQEELDRLVENGLKVYIGGSAYYSVVSSSVSYKAEGRVNIKMRTPTEILSKWYSDNHNSMRKKAIVSMKALIKTSSKWRIK